MNVFLLIIFMGIIGSFIGGMTNMIAIKMLFKPYEAKYLFGWRLPLTPGVIPRRREEASGKLGNIIIGHLLTPDVFIEKIQSPETRNFIMLFIDKQIETIENEKLSMRYFLERLSEGLSEKVAGSFNREIEDKVTAEGDRLYYKKIHDLIPPDAMTTMDVKVNALQPQIISKVEEYIESEKGYEDLYTMTDEFIENRGRLARSIKYIMTKESIVESIRREIIKLLHHPKMTDIQVRIIQDEYTRLKEYELSDLLSVNDKERLSASVSDVLKERINIDAILDRPIAEFNPEMFESFKERGKYKLLDNIIDYLGKNTGKIFEKLQLAQLIKKQIDSFELSHIEKLVFDIADKEFRMITVLGFVLGGIIGVLQGIIVAFL
ncbi:DUF445 domain-containing protein [Salinicoccus halodurans]|uniref:Uncharacterized membrane protein YheB, UPF0754 family n=1 Tax=Salinicoccus halodurans TaxID=407035 RepID=A0A0F7HM17_9STAP|nr:DUF445 family protein [Salinicoccus halodurans]AKG74437.1 hypothetical protein AAT16_09530 [Salinicoccus halodurans]SFK96001.1 Uncharacterized membrane protein YheB, UPF0754 family [Salinicoccus halodurans]